MQNLPMSDSECREFLQALDEAVQTVDVSVWESLFIESNLKTDVFTPRQRAKVAEMVEKYGDKINW